MGATPQRARQRRRRRWWLGSLVILAGGLILIWLVGANLILNTPWLSQRLSRHPEKLVMSWEGGWTLVPGRFHLRDLRIRGQGRRDQWYGEADRAVLAVKLLPLMQKEVVSDLVRLDGVVFRLRPRLDAVPDGSVDPAHLPDIPGLSNPPEIKPEFPQTLPPGKRWLLELRGIDLTAVRELWIIENRLTGSGTLRGEVHHEIRGSFFTQVDRFDVPVGRFSSGGTEYSTNLNLTLNGSLGPMRFRVHRGKEMVRRTIAELQLQGDLPELPVYQHYLGADTKSIVLSGGGHVDTRARVAFGKLVPGSYLRAEEPNLRVRLSEVLITGDARLAIDVERQETNTISTMVAEVSRLRFRHKDDTVEAEESGSLRLRTVARDPVIPEGFQDVAINLEVGPLELADTQVLNSFLPPSMGLSFLHGSFNLAADYSREGPGIGGEGRLTINGDAVSFRLGEREFTGQLEAISQYEATTNKLIRLAHTQLNVTNVIVSGINNRRSGGWFARIEVDDGTIALDEGREIRGDVFLHFLDIRPLLAVIRESEDSPGWARWIPNLKDLRGSAGVMIKPDTVAINDLTMKGKGTDVLAQMSIANGEPEGILYVRYGLISAGFDFRGDKKNWTIFGAKRGYFKDLEEMRQTNAPPSGGHGPTAR